VTLSCPILEFTVYQFDKLAALTTIQEIQISSEHAIQEAFREKTCEKMLQVFEAGFNEASAHYQKELSFWKQEAQRLAAKHGDAISAGGANG
jgi:hypothetical protein